MKHLRYLTANVFIPLVLGTAIYLCFRTETQFLSWIPFGLMMPEESLALVNSHSWIIYNLPDALWLYAFICSLLTVWESNSKIGIAYSFVALSVAVIFELLQKKGWATGTFDLLDIYFYIAATLMALMLFFQSRSNQYFHMNDG